MSFLFQKQDPLNLLPENGLSKPLGTFSENLSAAFESARANDQAYSEATVLRDQWGPIVDTINERAGMDAYSEFLGVKVRTFMHDGFTNPANNISSSILNAPATPGNAENQYMRAAQGIVDYLQENKDLFPDLQWVTHEEVLRRGMEVAQRERETLQDLEGRSPGFGNAIARFTGALGGLATDPINVETAFVGGAARSLYGAIFREAMLGAGVEAMSQAGVQEWYRTLGYEYTPQQFWTAVAMGGAFGGAMPVAFRAGGKTISLTTDQLKRGYQALRDSGAFTPTPVTRTAERQAEILEEEAAINPLADDAVHQERMEQATVAAEHAEPPAMSDTAPAELKPVSPELQKSYDAERANHKKFDEVHDKILALDAEKTELDDALLDMDLDEAKKIAEQQKPRRKRIKDEIDALKKEQDILGEENERILSEREALAERAISDGASDNLDGLIYRFDPDEIQVDAELFQFKAGGDEYGVSDRLLGIKIWDPVKAGQIVVYEFADGRRFIADGHQRLGLARRIKAEDPTQDVRLYGHIIREVDGITPEMARVIAAIKNIAEGTGTAIDAAKVLRVAPERIGELPPRSVLVRQAQGLTLLSDEAFGAVINGVVPANYAALVGRLIPEDEGLQSSAISVLAKTDPANEFQAEAIVRQVRDAGAERMTQESLFGEEIITESYFTERARILDRAQKQLRQDKAAFGTLVRNAERLEAEGNQLARSANERRANNDTQAIALLQALANRKGPVSDALNAAARAARERGSYAEPTRNFVDAVRRAAESGDFDRISTGDVGQLIDAPTQSRTSKDVSERAVEDFDEPGGQGVRDQADQLQTDIFGAEADAEAVAAPKARPIVETEESARAAVEGTAIVDPESGQPLVVYHGTDKQFDQFDLDAADKFDGGFAGSRAIYFSVDEYYAKAYGESRSGRSGRPSRTIRAYVDIKNPFMIRRIAKVDEIPFDIEDGLRAHYMKPFFERTGIEESYRNTDAEVALLTEEYKRIAPLVSGKMREITGGMDAMEMSKAMWAGDDSVDDFGSTIEINMIPELQTMRENLPRVLQELGYDGIIGRTSNVGKRIDFGEVVAFDPKQIHVFDQGEAIPVPEGSLGELKNLINSGADLATVDSHPAVSKAIKQMSSRKQTIEAESYGTDTWHEERIYTIDGEQVKGTEAALPLWEKQADELAWKEKGLTPEPVATNRQATIILGPPAAGKSTIANEWAVFSKSAILDSDEIKKGIPGFDGGIGAAAVHEESSDLSKLLQSVILDSGKNVVIPKVGHNASSISGLISLFKDRGYTVNVMDMSVSPKNAKLRMYGRFVSSGRLIPPSYLDQVGDLPSQTYNILKSEGVADGFAQIDNNGALGSTKPVTDKSGDNFLAGSSLDMDAGGGAVARAADGSGTETAGQIPVEEEGGQLVVPGAERISDKALAERKMAQALSGSDEAMPEGGLFDEGARAQQDMFSSQDMRLDLDEEIPVDLRVDPETGEITAQTVTMRQIQDDIAQDVKMLDRLRGCAK